MWITAHVKAENKTTCKYGDHTGLVELSRPCNSKTHTHTDSLCKLQESFLFHVAQIYTKRIITHSEVSFPTTQVTHRSFQLVYF